MSTPRSSPHVLLDVLTVPPGRYTLRLWLGTKLIPSTRYEFPGPKASTAARSALPHNSAARHNAG